MGEHDQLFKRTFRVPAHAAGELQAVLPKALFDALDSGSLELVPSDVVDEKLRERFTDALFQARFRGVPGYIWLLLEHQSKPDRWMTLRMLDYLTRTWMELLRREPGRARLPPVVCVVVHHGERGWTAPLELQDLVDGVAQVPELAPFVPSFRILVDDLVAQPDDVLVSRSLGTFPKVVLWVLRDSRSIERLLAHLRAWAEELERLAREAPEDAKVVMRYILAVSGDRPFEEVRQRILEVAPATEGAMATFAEQLIQKGEVKGEAKGRAEGRAEAILAVLATRGLVVSSEQRAVITACKDIAELDRWLRRAVTASQTDELFRG